MKINVTTLIVLMLLSTSVIMAQKTLAVENAETTTVSSSETTKSASIEEFSYEIEAFQTSEGEIDSNDKAAARKLQENKIESKKARVERAKITEAVRKRLKKRSKLKTINNELLEEIKKRAAFIEKNRIQENSKDRAKKETKQNY